MKILPKRSVVIEVTFVAAVNEHALFAQTHEGAWEKPCIIIGRMNRMRMVSFFNMSQS